MQWCCSKNKSPTKLNAIEIKFDTSDLFTNWENHWGKTPPSDFKATTSKNPLLSNTSKVRFVKWYVNYIKVCPLQWICQLIAVSFFYKIFLKIIPKAILLGNLLIFSNIYIYIYFPTVKKKTLIITNILIRISLITLIYYILNLSLNTKTLKEKKKQAKH